MDAYLWAKSLHLVAAISWFAGLFYLVRLFVYHVEALEKPEAEQRVLLPQYVLMEKRLWRAITTPAMLATVVFGVWLMGLAKAWTQPWFHVKLLFLILLFGYHGVCGRVRRQLAEGKCRWSGRGLRAWNEAATVLLFAIVFAAVFKRPLGAGYGLAAVLLLLAVGMALFKAARRKTK
jgi:putative membrane protein